MPALLPTDFVAQIVWLGRVTSQDDGIRSEAVQTLELDFAGAKGEYHRGETRPSCSRMLDQYPRGTKIRNVRQLSIVAQEDLDTIASKMDLDAIRPEWMGATLVLKGIPDFSHVPPSSRLQAPNGTTLTIDMENRPCQFPAREIEKDHEGYGKRFKAAAKDRRGVTAWVEREGSLALGDALTLHIPDQPVWAQLDRARSGTAKAEAG